MRSILFVCLGNICRSPLAEHLFRRHAESRAVSDRFDVASRGTGGWHEGEGADPRTVQIAAAHGWTLLHVARQLRPAEDFERFELLVAMDKQNLRNIITAGAPPHRVRLMRSFDPAFDPDHAPDVPDPYYGGPAGFLAMYQMLDAAALGLLEHALKRTAAH